MYLIFDSPAEVLLFVHVLLDNMQYLIQHYSGPFFHAGHADGCISHLQSSSMMKAGLQ